MSVNFTENLNLTKSIIETKQNEMNTMFDRLLVEYNITDENIKDAIYDYCYNDFEGPILTNYLAELNEPD